MKQAATCIAFSTHPATMQRVHRESEPAGRLRAAARGLALFPPGYGGCLTSPASAFPFIKWLEWRSPKLSYCLAQGSSRPPACSVTQARGTQTLLSSSAAHSLYHGVLSMSLITRPRFRTPGLDILLVPSCSRKESTRIPCSAKCLRQ